jgi:hypothetical protein
MIYLKDPGRPRRSHGARAASESSGILGHDSFGRFPLGRSGGRPPRRAGPSGRGRKSTNTSERLRVGPVRRRILLLHITLARPPADGGLSHAASPASRSGRRAARTRTVTQETPTRTVAAQQSDCPCGGRADSESVGVGPGLRLAWPSHSHGAGSQVGRDPARQRARIAGCGQCATSPALPITVTVARPGDPASGPGTD